VDDIIFYDEKITEKNATGNMPIQVAGAVHLSLNLFLFSLTHYRRSFHSKNNIEKHTLIISKNSCLRHHYTKWK
jgi:hypothetical protein